MQLTSEDARLQGDSSQTLHVYADICVKQKQLDVKFKLHLVDALRENNESFFCIVFPRLFNSLVQLFTGLALDAFHSVAKCLTNTYINSFQLHTWDQLLMKLHLIL